MVILDSVIQVSAYIQFLFGSFILRYCMAYLKPDMQFTIFQLTISGHEVALGFKWLPDSIKNKLRKSVAIQLIAVLIITLPDMVK